VTFELSGFVYDVFQGPSAGIEGATVEVSNYGYGQGGSDQTVSGPDGYYFVSMPAHEANTVYVHAEAEGYYGFSEEIGYVWDYMGGTTYDIEMSPPIPGDLIFDLWGIVYDVGQGPSAGIEGATVEVINWGFGRGGSDQTVSGPDGTYYVSMEGHDTNYVYVYAQAEGYHDFYESIGSVMEYMWQSFDIGMSQKTLPEYDKCDLNKDGAVDAGDLFILQHQWHTGAPVAPARAPSGTQSAPPSRAGGGRSTEK